MTETYSSDQAARACRQCAGVLVATHMLTKAYELDATGRWHRRVADFVEDVVVVCRTCSSEQEGRIEVSGCSFVFNPASA